MDTFLSPYKNYANFSGRSGRTEYWTFTLFHFVLSFVVIVLIMTFALFEQVLVATILGLTYLLLTLVLVIPSFAITVRRFHDLGLSGLMILFNFIPVIGPWIILFYMLFPSEDGMNQYGRKPKNVATNRDSPIPTGPSAAAIFAPKTMGDFECTRCFTKNRNGARKCVYCKVSFS